MPSCTTSPLVPIAQVPPVAAYRGKRRRQVFPADVCRRPESDRALDDILTSGDGRLVMATAKNNGIGHLIGAPYSVQASEQIRSSPGSPFTNAGATGTVDGITGEFKNTSSRASKRCDGNQAHSKCTGGECNGESATQPPGAINRPLRRRHRFARHQHLN